MQIDKEYRIISSMISAWDNAFHLNKNIRELIDKHGGSFIVLGKNTTFVNKVKFKDGIYGSCYEDDNLEYFEISDSEYKYFEEVTNKNIIGVNNINITVTSENADEMIDLIKKSFKK